LTIRKAKEADEKAIKIKEEFGRYVPHNIYTENVSMIYTN
jgi:hypothetical protein